MITGACLYQLDADIADRCDGLFTTISCTSNTFVFCETSYSFETLIGNVFTLLPKPNGLHCERHLTYSTIDWTITRPDDSRRCLIFAIDCRLSGVNIS